jgi:hypothetical protein
MSKNREIIKALLKHVLGKIAKATSEVALTARRPLIRCWRSWQERASLKGNDNH